MNRIILHFIYAPCSNIGYFIYPDSALNLGREANPDLDINGSPDLNINGSQDYQFPAFDDPAVISKIVEFHAPNRCSTCYEKFPSISVNDADTCTRCHNDKHIPKLFSADNNILFQKHL